VKPSLPAQLYAVHFALMMPLPKRGGKAAQSDEKSGRESGNLADDPLTGSLCDGQEKQK
jgi:hypothetical protein